ncbi:MAG TPA: metallophosphoesterase [Blastocatellia bacterium]|nr:metallophosphoesterase [Blastocatellia bacterium]
MPEFHAEPYLYLAGLTHKAALIAWGGFYFRVRASDRAWKLVDDSDLDHVHPPRRESIGARSEPYGVARVEVFDEQGSLAAFAETQTTNHVWISGLRPDTQYRYRVIVNGEEWASGERRDWASDSGRQGLFASGRAYDNRFRTHPHPDERAPLTFAVLGDFGTGIRKPVRPGRHQKEVADALEATVDRNNVRLLLTTGDNIYSSKTFLGIPIDETGDEDDDWFFTFYQPYRYIINRIPVYPCVGNHDASETEASDDREQLLDNFFLNERFFGEESAGRASIGPGLFYRFNYGADIEFICIDTSRQSLLFGKRFFLHPNHASFIDSALPAVGAGSSDLNSIQPPGWRVPFTHHPPFCAGPMHSNSRSMIETLVPLFKRSGVRAVFSGHEHNFQYSMSDGITYVLSGAGGKVRRGPLSDFASARTVGWASEPHFLLVEAGSEQMLITPIGKLGPNREVAAIDIVGPSGEAVATPIIVPRATRSLD